ncbi:hypothetical protein DERP_004935 [Dermatophagoides pteronyssinus]|uniref:Uncharacterized protein n=1 Tax=Dermatophagoides pteronyssinus TaxID=6956 RepID=A0ABQ8JTJ4_DERPT|nr:hypothetical protein DERP_004935 [Dermatophagoides pteronyssinus]
MVISCSSVQIFFVFDDDDNSFGGVDGVLDDGGVDDDAIGICLLSFTLRSSSSSSSSNDIDESEESIGDVNND